MAHDESGSIPESALSPATRALATGATANPSPNQRASAYALQIGLQSDPPGAWAGNVWEQYSKYRGIVSLAIRPYVHAMRAAKISVLRRKSNVRKSLGGSGHYSRDDEYEPVEADHPLAQIVEEPGGPNGAWGFGDELAFLALQRHITGVGYAWCPPNTDGKPVRFFALATGSVTPGAPPGSPEYPQGSYIVNPYMGWVSSTSLIAPTTPIPAEQVPAFKEFNPYSRTLALSTLATGAKEIDLLDAITDFRWTYFNKGAALDTFIQLPGADDDAVARFKEQFKQEHVGSRNARKVLVAGGAIGDGAGAAKIQQLAPNAKDLDFPSGFEQSLSIVLAFFNVPKILAGFGDTSNYATYHGELKRFYDIAITPFCRDLSAFLSKSLARAWSDYAGEYRIEVEPQIPADVEAERAAMQFGIGQGAITVNEWRKANGMKPVEGGDVPASIYQATLQQKMQPQPQPGAPGAPAAMGGTSAAPGAPPSEEQGAISDAEQAPEGDAEQAANLPLAGDDSEQGVQDATLQAAFAALGMGGSGAVRKAFDESKHPRDEHGQFIDKDEIAAARSDPEKAASLRAQVRPEDSHKLEAILNGDEGGKKLSLAERRKLRGEREIGKGSAARVEAIRRAAEQIEVTDNYLIPGGDDLNAHLDARREEYAESGLDQVDPGVRESDVAKEAGWTDENVADKAAEIVSRMVDDQTSAAAANEAINDWYSTASEHGSEAVEELAEALEDDFPEVANQLRELADVADEEMEAARESLVASAQEEIKQASRDEWDAEHRADEEARWHQRHGTDASSLITGKWGLDAKGQPAFAFDTASGRRYKATVWDSAGEKPEFVFEDDAGGFGVTGAGGAHEVISKTSAAASAYVAAKSPPILYFTAAEESRAQLYSRLVKTLAEVHSEYAAMSAPTQDGRGKVYFIVRRDQLPNVAGRVRQQLGERPLDVLVKSLPVGSRLLKPITEEQLALWFPPVMKAAAPVNKPGSARSPHRAEGEIWTTASGKRYTKKNGKIVPAPQQRTQKPASSQPVAQPQQGGTGAGEDRAALHAAILKVPGAKQLGFTEQKLAQMPADAVKELASKMGVQPTAAQKPKGGTAAAPKGNAEDFHGQILKKLGRGENAKTLGLNRDSLAKMHPDAVKTIAAQLGITPPEEHYAPHAATVPASTPTAKTTLQRAHEWSDAMAAKHAAKVAKHLGVPPATAQKILGKAIRQIAEHALKNGGRASGTLTVGGKQLKLGVGKPGEAAQSGTTAAPSRPPSVPSKPSNPPKPEELGFGQDAPPRPEAQDRPGTAAGAPTPAEPDWEQIANSPNRNRGTGLKRPSLLRRLRDSKLGRLGSRALEAYKDAVDRGIIVAGTDEERADARERRAARRVAKAFDPWDVADELRDAGEYELAADLEDLLETDDLPTIRKALADLPELDAVSKGFDPNEARDESGKWTVTAQKKPHEMTRSEYESRAIDGKSAAESLDAIRAGDARSKNRGDLRKVNREEPHVLVNLPLAAFTDEHIQHLRESTGNARVSRYVGQKIDTPIHATPRRKGMGFQVNDGGHRFVAALERGDEAIPALVPVSAHKKLIESALESGASVPDEVLADYPDLAERFKKSAGMNTLSASEGGFLVPEETKPKKKKRKVPVAALVAKAIAAPLPGDWSVPSPLPVQPVRVLEQQQAAPVPPAPPMVVNLPADQPAPMVVNLPADPTPVTVNVGAPQVAPVPVTVVMPQTAPQFTNGTVERAEDGSWLIRREFKGVDGAAVAPTVLKARRTAEGAWQVEQVAE